jgi:hypothetical protein
VIRLFTGWDEREAVGWHAFAQSVIERSSVPVAITPFSGQQRDGTNAFTYSRFLVPYLCHFSGMAIFADGVDMLCRGDLAELWELRDPWKAVQVVKHEYATRHPRKYVGTDLEAENRDYPRKNWSSLVIWNCAHFANGRLTPEYVAEQGGEHLHRFGWLEDGQIGELPAAWNWLADEYGESEGAKLLHWTAGIPGFHHYRETPHAEEWKGTLRRVTRGMA